MADGRPRLWPTLLRALLPVALILGATWAGGWAADRLLPGVSAGTASVMQPLVLALVALYAVMLLLPFVPAVELGMTLMMVLGTPVVPLVWGATVLALTVGFLIGRLVPERAVRNLFRTLRLARAERLMTELEPLGTEARLIYLTRNAHSRLLPFLLRSRYLALAVSVNTPGNMLIGGGGGIALIAGFSRLFRLPAYILTIALATTPAPILMYLWP